MDTNKTTTENNMKTETQTIKTSTGYATRTITRIPVKSDPLYHGLKPVAMVQLTYGPFRPSTASGEVL